MWILRKPEMCIIEIEKEYKKTYSLYQCCSVWAQVDHEVDKEPNPPMQNI